MGQKHFYTITGTELSDYIRGTYHRDMIYAGLGDDTIISGRRKDIIFAGEGDDYIHARRGHDKVFGGLGDDFIKTGRGRDTVFGGEGNDTIIAGRGRDVIHGGEGNDRINAGRGKDTVYGGAGDDTILGGRGHDRIDGGDDFDLVTYKGAFADYSLQQLNDGNWQIGSSYYKDKGTDILSNVEVLYFVKDDLYVFLQPQNTAPTAVDDIITSDEDIALVIDPETLLNNDKDADGDALHIARVDDNSTLGVRISLDEERIHYDPADMFQHLKHGESITDTFTYTISDGSDETGTATVSILVEGRNDAPTLSVETNVTVSENTTFITTATATDIDGDTVSYEITGGADAHLFQLDANSGELSFIDAPDFENPMDHDQDNTYAVEISTIDDWGAVDSDLVTIQVSDIDETPDVEGRINEIHYNNAGDDVGEFVEIRVGSGDDISLLELQIYDGSSKTSIQSIAASEAIKTSDAGYDYYVFRFDSAILPDKAGYALVNGTEVLEFLSHEGRFVADDGAAETLRSDDIGVAENDYTQIGHSLQRNDDGSWRDPSHNTAGISNDLSPEPNIRLNEFHYDNASTDQNEFIEVRTGIGEDITDVTIYLYNGSGGTVYDQKGLSEFTTTYEGGYTYYTWDLPVNGLQNGGAAADGIVLAQGDTILEFISYEGEMTAKYGIAAGYTSTDINVREGNSTGFDDSVQRNTFGVWMQPQEATKGTANTGHVEVQLDARINEIHYDNDGLDIGEFIEIRVGQGQSVDKVTVELYNGGNGSVYNTVGLSDYDIATSADGFDFYVIDGVGLQDGSPDGLALVYEETVIEFLSYEGKFTAQDGSAQGLTSYDIGVAESEFGDIGYSLQRNEDGSWFDPSPETRGESNLTDTIVTEDYLLW